MDYLFNLTDVFSSKVIFLPQREKELTAQKCADLYFQFVYPQWGLPRTVLADQDVQWENNFWKSLFEAVRTTLTKGTAYHPKLNVKIEQMHCNLNLILRQWVNKPRMTGLPTSDLLNT